MIACIMIGRTQKLSRGCVLASAIYQEAVSCWSFGNPSKKKWSVAKNSARAKHHIWRQGNFFSDIGDIFYLMSTMTL